MPVGDEDEVAVEQQRGEAERGEHRRRKGRLQ